MSNIADLNVETSFGVRQLLAMEPIAFEKLRYEKFTRTMLVDTFL